jgi:hypothetical protein
VHRPPRVVAREQRSDPARIRAPARFLVGALRGRSVEQAVRASSG